jgi:uncharacterized membrane protein
VRREHTGLSERLERDANRSLVLSLVGFFLCFIPIFQVISIVFYVRARALARQLNVSVPAQATTGFVLSSLSLVLVVGGMAWAIVRR